MATMTLDPDTWAGRNNSVSVLRYTFITRDGKTRESRYQECSCKFRDLLRKFDSRACELVAADWRPAGHREWLPLYRAEDLG